MEYKSNELEKVLDTGIALSKEKNRNKLLDMILDAGMELTNCDAGTLYICKGNKLYFQVMKTISMGVDQGKNGEKIDLPPVEMSEANICSYTVIHKKVLNIENVYESDEFDFSGPYRYDKMTGYHTRSMITIPLLNQEDNAVGVLQLINAKDADGNIVKFPKRMEHIILSLASQAAIAVSNISYMEEIKTQMWSFTEAMAEAIDTRTPYNANHVRNVAKYAGLMADYINERHKEGLTEDYFDENRKEQLVLGALLHDIGKVSTPLSVMNKATRLETKLHDIEMRLNLFMAKYKVQVLEGTISQEQYERNVAKTEEALALAYAINECGFLDDEKKQALKKVAEYTFEDGTEQIPYFTEEEIVHMSVVKGTLTDEERIIMESHVEMTERILSKVHFNSQYKNAMKWAIEHHECLDGTGYPKKISGDDLSLESRILAVADICDALLATDRPYKKPLPKEKAFAIMKDMADKGKIDGGLVELLQNCI